MPLKAVILLFVFSLQLADGTLYFVIAFCCYLLCSFIEMGCLLLEHLSLTGLLICVSFVQSDLFGDMGGHGCRLFAHSFRFHCLEEHSFEVFIKLRLIKRPRLFFFTQFRFFLS